jgi:putative glutamine amidotransferase
VLNVACGGTLIGDIRTEHPSRIAHDKSTHTVALERTSRLGRIFQQRVLTVNSTHHQAVKEPGKGLRAVAHAPDGIIEAVEAVDTAVFAVGVQFHPERMCAKNPLIAALFRRFVENC